MAQVNFVYGIGSEEAREIKSHVYTIIIDGVAINASCFFETPSEEYEFGYRPVYSQTIRDQVLSELKALAERKSFASIQQMSAEELSQTLKGEAAVNKAARQGLYEVNSHFGWWFERQLEFASRWVKEDQEGLVIGQLMLAMLCHIHSTGFYNDMTMSWKEAVRTGRKDVFINNLTKVFAVA